MVNTEEYRSIYKHKVTGELIKVKKVACMVYRYLTDSGSESIPFRKLKKEYKFIKYNRSHSQELFYKSVC